jgi:hypothetical protein
VMPAHAIISIVHTIKSDTVADAPRTPAAT